MNDFQKKIGTYGIVCIREHPKTYLFFQKFISRSLKVFCVCDCIFVTSGDVTIAMKSTHVIL